MFSFLSRPYPHEMVLRRVLMTALLFGVFVAAFLFFFQPFGIQVLGNKKALVCAGFGAWCALAIILLNGLILPLFPKAFQEQTWTVGKEILWSLTHCAVIGLGNSFYVVWLGLGAWTWELFLTYEVYTVAVGLFPVTISVLLREVRLSRLYREQSSELTNHLHPLEVTHSPVTLPSDNKNEALTLDPDCLLYFEATDNYVTVFYRKEDAVAKAILRSTLKTQEETLAEIPGMFRAHKSYLVNCNRITKVSGNAQGYKLQLEGVEMLIPVSRKQNEELRKRVW
ncbi:MAG: LytTR family DNA-binding domain-containing protein [Bacteroidota bacterium]